MLHFTTQQHSKIPALAAILLVMASTWRLPLAGDNVRMSMVVFFEIAVAVLLSGYIWQQNKWISMFLLLSVFSMFYPFYDRSSYLAFQGVFYGVVWLALLVTIVKNTDNLLNAIALVALANVFFLILQYFGIDPVFKSLDGEKTMVGLMGNRNLSSAILAFCFPAFLRPKWLYFMPLIIIGLILSKSTGGMLAVGIGFIVFCMLNGFKFWPGFLVLCGFIIMGLMGMNFYDPLRLDTWDKGLRMFTQHWIFGSGIGHWKTVFLSVRQQPGDLWWSTAHNEYIQALFEMGFLFIPIAVGYFYSIIKHLGNKGLVLPITAIAIIAVNCLVNFPMHIATTALIAVTWMAIFEINKNDKIPA